MSLRSQAEAPRPARAARVWDGVCGREEERRDMTGAIAAGYGQVAVGCVSVLLLLLTRGLIIRLTGLGSLRPSSWIELSAPSDAVPRWCFGGGQFVGGMDDGLERVRGRGDELTRKEGQTARLASGCFCRIRALGVAGGEERRER